MLFVILDSKWGMVMVLVMVLVMVRAMDQVKILAGVLLVMDRAMDRVIVWCYTRYAAW